MARITYNRESRHNGLHFGNSLREVSSPKAFKDWLLTSPNNIICLQYDNHRIKSQLCGIQQYPDGSVNSCY